jgi:hypothetical protein
LGRQSVRWWQWCWGQCCCCYCSCCNGVGAGCILMVRWVGCRLMGHKGVYWHVVSDRRICCNCMALSKWHGVGVGRLRVGRLGMGVGLGVAC